MNDDLHLSSAGANLIKHFEGCLKPHAGKYKAYKCPANVTTIGWGTTSEHGHPLKMDTVWSKAQCDSAFLHDMEKFENDVKRLVKVRLSGFQFDALVSFTYNVGPGPTPPVHGAGLGGSTLLKKVNVGDFEGAAKEFIKWNKAGGKVMAGLTRRRKSESLLFQGISDDNYDGDPDMPLSYLSDPMPQAVDAAED